MDNSLVTYVDSAYDLFEAEIRRDFAVQTACSFICNRRQANLSAHLCIGPVVDLRDGYGF
jgi:hypothetical protein